MLRAVLYLRLSESDEASTSIVRQEEDLRARADREGWDVVAVLTDDGISGGKRREKAKRALRMLQEDTADVLAVWKMDRWTRQGLSALADVMEVLEERAERSRKGACEPALFVCLRDNLDSDAATWDLHAGMLVAVAKMERENTRTRVTSSIARLRKEGRYAGGTVPYGYRTAPRTDGPGRVLVVDEAEAAVVRQIATRLLDGESLYAIALDLNGRRVVTRRETAWSIQALRQMLTADAILGRVTHHGQLLRDEQGLPLQVWPPVLDLETWVKVHVKVGPSAPASTPRRRRARLLSGLISCAYCQAPLYVRTNGSGRPAYGCSSRSNGRTCPGVSMVCDAVEDFVTARFLAAYGDAEVVERVVETSATEAAVADVSRAIATTLQEMTDDDADMAALGARLAHLKARRAVAQATPSEPVVRLVPTGRTHREVWEGADLTGRQDILRQSITLLAASRGLRGCRTFDPARLTIVDSPPFSPADPDRFRRGAPSAPDTDAGRWDDPAGVPADAQWRVGDRFDREAVRYRLPAAGPGTDRTPWRGHERMTLEWAAGAPL